MFWDIRRRSSYEQFIEQARVEKPYRDSNKAYPLGDRKYSSRHWRMREDGSIDIYYINREAQDQFENGKEMRVNYETWHKRRKLATVYPDSTVEFHNTSGQGDHGLLSRLFGCGMYQSSKHGGVVLQVGRQKHPLFKGQKFKLGSMECVTPYEIFQRRVNRKSGAAAMEKYKEFLQVGKAMTMAMDYRGLVETAQDLMKEINKDSPDGQHQHYALKYKQLQPMFFELIEKKHYVDAAVMFSLNFDVNGARWRLTAADPHAYNEETWVDNYRARLFPRIHTNLSKEVYYHHNTFNMKQLEMGDLPSSTWHSLVLCDGKPVERL